ncbi:Ig-like domain-containing protein, partial [Pluralibacter gergoviae]
MSNVRVVEVIIRKTAEKTALRGEGNISVAVSAPSVIEIQGSAQDVERYVRQGKDLLIYMKDGSVIRCSHYFAEDPEDKLHSELVFNDQQHLTHITFAETGDTAALASAELTPQATPIASIQPFLEQGNSLDDAPWGWIAGAALGGGAIGALLAHDGGGGHKTRTEVIDNTRDVESARPTFMVSDNQGDKQGVLAAKEVTDDKTPTFSGTGQPGATIQIKDSSGTTVASAQVDKDGKWSVTLSPQNDGEYTWAVVQIDGTKVTPAGDITLTISSATAAIALDTTGGDNIINADEQGKGFTISGASSHLPEGTALTVTLNGKTYAAKVGADGKWNVAISAADAKALGDGAWTISVSGKDATGNTVTGSQVLQVDTHAPIVSVDPVTKDNIVNAAEHGADLSVTGKTTAEPGQTVTVTLNGKNYTATVGTDGNWSVTVGAADVKNLADGNQNISVSISDKAGNAGSAKADFTVDTAAPAVTVDKVTGDDIINGSERGQVLIVTGEAKNAGAGDVVTLTLNGKNYTAVVDAQGKWSVGIAKEDMAALDDGAHTVTVSVTDKAGNTGSVNHEIAVDATPPGLTIDKIAEDGVINSAEKGQDLTISGTAVGLEKDAIVTVTLNGKTYQAKVDENGSWSTTVPADDVQALGDKEYLVTATAADPAGNIGSASHSVNVDTVSPTVLIDRIAGDDVINAAEAEVGQEIRGRVINAEAGDRVIVVLGDKEYATTVQPDLSWSVNVPAGDLTALGNGPLTVTATVTDSYGNRGGDERHFAIDANIPGLRINTIAGDDVINSLEHGQDLIVTGTSSGLKAGASVTVSINGKDYAATVLADGSWSAAISREDVGELAAGVVNVSASGTSEAGNPVHTDRPVTVNLADVAITIDSVTDDNVLNAVEKGQSLLLSGSTANVEAGQEVTVVLGGKTYTATVDADGSWHLTVPEVDVAALKDGSVNVQASVENGVGNGASAGCDFRVDTVAPTLTIDPVSGDNMLNAAEASQPLIISGTSSAEAGQVVNVTFNGRDYTATVGSDGRWSLEVPASGLAGMDNGPAQVAASVSDRAGNPTSAGSSVLVDTAVPQITINTIAGDDIINSAEHNQALLIAGKASGAEAGDAVKITLNGREYLTVLDANGNWSVGVPAADVKALAEQPHTVTVTVTDKAGNANSLSHDVTVNLAQPTLTINTVSGDDVINSAEKGENLIVSGTASGVKAGTDVSITLNGNTYHATVGDNGTWSTAVPANDVKALGEARYDIRASVTDGAGNSGSASHPVIVDATLPAVTIERISGDDVVNAAEVAAGLNIGGRVINAQPGNTVTVTIAGREYKATVESDLSWTINVPAGDLKALGNGPLTAIATVTNGHGNTGGGERDFSINANMPGLRINTVAGDDVINCIEHGQDLIVSGSSSGLKAGAAVTVTLNGKDYAATVLADGTWRAAVPKEDVGELAAGAVKVTASGTSEAGNPISVDRIARVDLSEVAISIDTITEDNVLNAAEKGQDLALSGTTSGVESGQEVTIAFGDKIYTAVVNNGSWSCTVPSADLAGQRDGSASLQVSVSNVNGNSASASHDYLVDTTAPAVTIDVISGDNMLNAQEAGQPLTISGTSTAEVGQQVNVTFNGHDYPAVVGADGRWTLDVPAADMAGIQDGPARITAEVTDRAGNPARADTSVTVDITVPQITIDTVSGDDIINSAEHNQALLITGKAVGAAAGDRVTVTLNGHDYLTVLDASGNWSIGVPAADVKALGEQTHDIIVTVTDRAGNSSEGKHDIAVNLAQPELTINTIAGDDIINSTEKGQDLILSGTATGVKPGTEVSVTLNGKTYHATVEANGSWHATVPAADVGALGEARYEVVASVTDAAGNSGNTTHTAIVDSRAPAVVIDRIAGDDVINAAEAAAGQNISGRVINAEVGNTVTVTIAGKEYITTVQPGLSWSINVPAGDLKALGNGPLTVTATVTNGHQNSGSGERDFTISAGMPGVRIDTIAGDDVINRIEHGQDLIVTGSSDGLKAGAAVTVTLNGKDYAATVLADGTWRAAVPKADVGELAAGAVKVTVSGISEAGNPVQVDRIARVDLAEVAISIDNVTQDNVLNAAERGENLILSGSTAGVESGQKVTIAFGDKIYTAVVNNGSWSCTVPSADLAGQRDGSASLQVSVSNANGNGASAGHDYRVDTLPPAISIDVISGDNMLNAAEAGQPLTISGTSTAEAGQKVIVTFNGRDYPATVGSDGTWSLEVPAADMAGIANAPAQIVATVSDRAGNPSSAGTSIVVDTVVPEVTINTVAGDDIINSAEHSEAMLITGSATGAEAGDKVTVTLNGHSYITVLDANGSWSIGVPAADVKALGEQTHDIIVTVTDKAGNSSEGKHNVTVNLAQPELTINTVAGDDIINSVEKGQDLILSGTATGVKPGTEVSVTLNGKTYHATVEDSGVWHATVPAADVGALGEARYDVTASVTDGAGNSGSTAHPVIVDATLPAVIVDRIAGDDVINNAEAAAGQNISGRVVNAQAGNTVTVTIAGKEYTAIVQPDLSWTVSVSTGDLNALGNGPLTVTASVTNDRGNTGGGERDFTISTNMPGLRIDTVAGDDVINSIEHGQDLIVTGTSSGLQAGSAVTVTLNGKDYAATVLADGTWRAAVPKADVGELAAGAVKVTASGTSEAGDAVQVDRIAQVDLSEVAISIDNVTDDNVLNAAERGENLILSGSTAGVESGQKVTIAFGDKIYTAVVNNGSWSCTVPAADLAGQRDGSASLQVSVSNANGNSASASHDYRVDTTAPAVTIDVISGDNMLNAQEAGQPLTLSGTSTAEVGQKVIVTFNGHDYTATVGSDGRWTLDVPAADMAGIQDGPARITAEVTDRAGNPASGDSTILVDTTVPAVTINKVAGDDIINSAEHGQALLVTGSATGAQAGDKVTVTLNGHDYVTVLDANGSWSIGVPASDVGALAGTDYTITASVTDRAGNSSEGQRDIAVNLAQPELTIDTIAGDDIINSTEKGQDLILSGTATGVKPGTEVSVTLNGQTYSATVGADGTWHARVPEGDVAALGEAGYTVVASVIDSAGNGSSADRSVLVDSALPGVIINTVAGDDIINTAESKAALDISGRVFNAAAGDTVTVTVGNNTYTTTVEPGLTWKVTVPAADMDGLTTGKLDVAATVTNGHGNTGAGARDVAVNLDQPTLSLDPVTGDNIINLSEHGQDLILTGTSSGLMPGAAVTVTVNGADHEARVLADGTWSVTVPKAEVEALTGESVNVKVSGTSEAGNPVDIDRDITLDLSPISISVDPVTDDNVLNAAEKGASVEISGKTTGVEAGREVTLTLGDKTYTAVVQADGSWKTSIDAGDLKDGDATFSVSVETSSNNEAHASWTFTVDTTAPTLTIDPIAADNMLNAAEAGQPLTLSGTSSAEAGQTVNVTFNGHDYTATVGTNGRWTLQVPADDMKGIANGDAPVTATVTDRAGNPADAGASVLVDTAVPEVTINKVAGDDIINSAEHGQALLVTGSATNAQAGDKVTVTLNGHDYVTVLDANGSWSIGVPASDVAALADADYTITAAVTDKAGNSNHAGRDIAVDLAKPVLTIDTVAGDDVINSAEKGGALTLSGTATGVAAGADVSVTLNGNTYHATVEANGTWSLAVSAADVAALGEAGYRIVASVTGSSGNEGSVGRDVLVDSALPGVIINAVAGDDVINTAESKADLDISGRVINAAEGDIVTVKVGANTYTTTVEPGLTWKVTVPAADMDGLTTGKLDVAATVTNGHGNTGAGARDVAVNLDQPTLSLDPVTGDNIINLSEHGQDLILTGTSCGLMPGAAVTVTVNGADHEARVLADGTWSVTVPKAEVEALTGESVNVKVSGTSEAGNPVETGRDITLDLSPISISVDPVTDDNVLNAAEKGAPVAISGKTTGVEAGQEVTLTLGDKTYTAVVQADGSWKTSIDAGDLKDGDATFSVSVENQSGNGADGSHTFAVDTTAPTLTIDPIAADNMLNSDEAGKPLTLSGTSSAEAGQTVNVTFNGRDYTAEVG